MKHEIITFLADSLKIITDTVSSISSSTDIVERLSNLEGNFDSISFTWTLFAILFTTVIAVFSIIIGIVIPLRADRRIKELENKLESKISEIGISLDEVSGKINKLEKLEKNLLETQKELKGTSAQALRSLYEGSDNNPTWKFIWSIRYSNWFFKNNKLPGLLIRLNHARKEFDKATNIKALRNTRKGIEHILASMILCEDPKIRSLASELNYLFKQRIEKPIE